MNAVTRARRWFWALVLVAVLTAGTLYQAVQAPAGPWTALRLLFAGTVLALSITQALRLLRALNGPLVMDVRRLYEDPSGRR